MTTLNLKEYGTKEHTQIPIIWFADEVQKMATGGSANQDIIDFLKARSEFIEENVKVITPRPMKVELSQKLVKFDYKNQFINTILNELDEAGLL